MKRFFLIILCLILETQWAIAQESILPENYKKIRLDYREMI